MKKIIVLLLLFSNIAWSDQTLNLSANCSQGLRQIDDTPFSFYISCEGALGNYIGIVMTGKWSEYGSKSWPIGDRFWYEDTWGADVSSVYFFKEKMTLYVATSSYYGKGGLYKLVLKDRKSSLLFPKSPELISYEEAYVIKGVKPGNKLTLETKTNGKISEVEVELQESRGQSLTP